MGRRGSRRSPCHAGVSEGEFGDNGFAGPAHRSKAAGAERQRGAGPPESRSWVARPSRGQGRLFRTPVRNPGPAAARKIDGAAASSSTAKGRCPWDAGQWRGRVVVQWGEDRPGPGAGLNRESSRPRAASAEEDFCQNRHRTSSCQHRHGDRSIVIARECTRPLVAQRAGHDTSDGTRAARTHPPERPPHLLPVRVSERGQLDPRSYADSKHGKQLGPASTRLTGLMFFRPSPTCPQELFRLRVRLAAW